MTIEEGLQTIEEHVHTMVALAHRLREMIGRKATVDKEVQTMATEQPMTTVLRAAGFGPTSFGPRSRHRLF